MPSLTLHLSDVRIAVSSGGFYGLVASEEYTYQLDRLTQASMRKHGEAHVNVENHSGVRRVFLSGSPLFYICSLFL